MTIDEWLAVVEAELGLPPTDRNLVLDLARDVAHAATRPAAPLTTYLLGLAAGRSGTDPAAVAAHLRALLPEVSTDVTNAGATAVGATVVDEPDRGITDT